MSLTSIIIKRLIFLRLVPGHRFISRQTTWYIWAGRHLFYRLKHALYLSQRCLLIELRLRYVEVVEKWTIWLNYANKQIKVYYCLGQRTSNAKVNFKLLYLSWGASQKSSCLKLPSSPERSEAAVFSGCQLYSTILLFTSTIEEA